VGQDDLVEALTLVGVDPDLDGLLIRGEKGTAKSTAVRALAGALPDQTVVADCPYGCHPSDPALACANCRERTDPPTETRPAPLVTLPLGATRERVVGTLSVADAMAGDFEFDPGLLARAHRGVLYVDEVNLLDDHLVDVLLDAAAGGVNRVERDGVSVVHPASFTIVGTMNPEEGELRPQLRDRFALSVRVSACEAVTDRVAIVEGALEGWDDGAGTTDHAGKIRRARRRVDDVTVPRDRLREAATACRDAGVDGHRADVATVRAARALAALDGRREVGAADVRRGAELAIAHRLRSRPFEPDRDPEDVLDDEFDDGDAEADGEGEGDCEERADGLEDAEDGDGGDGAGGPDEHGGETPDGDGDGGDETGSEGEETRDGGDDGDTPDSDPRPEPDGSDSGEDGVNADLEADGDAEGERDGAGGGEDGGGGSDADDPDDTAAPRPLGGQRATANGDRGAVGGSEAVAPGAGAAPEVPVPDPDVRGDEGDGRVEGTPEAGGDGPRVRTERATAGESVDAAASVRAAASRGAEGVERRDLRQSVAASDAETLVVFAVDASASMRPAMRAAKGTVLELLKDAYRERDEVGFVGFAGTDAEVLLPPTDSVTLAARHLKDLPTGDRTPLPAGIDAAREVLERADPDAGVVVLVSDGRANVADGSPVEATRAAARRLAETDASVLVVDADERERGVLDRVVAATDGRRVSLSALSADRVDAVAGAARDR
jgi:magnesium chelatase subunit D